MILMEAGKGSVEEEKSRHWHQNTWDSKFSACYECCDLLKCDVV